MAGIDYDSEPTTDFSLFVNVNDGVHTLSVPVNVRIYPINEHPPVFVAPLTVDWPESVDVGTSIVTMTTGDQDKYPHNVPTFSLDTSGNHYSKYYPKVSLCFP